MQHRGRLQRLRSKFHHARHGVRHRVATTISNIRDRSYAYAGFPTARPAGTQDECSDPAKARYMQLANTIVRALLVEEVTYEPSSLLKKSRKAAVLITGADLVLVKLTAATKAGSSSTVSRSASTPAEGTAGSAAAAAAGVSRLVSSRGDGGFDAAAAAAAEARASVLAQHELNKMVKCEVSGDRLELEFIVTGGAQFKVSAAALGLNAASFNSSSTTQLTPTAAVKTGSSSSSAAAVGGLSSRFLEQEEEAAEDDTDAAAAADMFRADAADAAEAAGLGRRGGSGERQQQQQQQRRQGLAVDSLDSGAVLGSLDMGQEESTAQLSGRAGSSGRASSGEVDERPVAGYGTAAFLEADGSSLQRASIRSFDLLPPNSNSSSMSTVPADRTLGSRTLKRLINRYNSSSGAFPAGSPLLAVTANGVSVLPVGAAGGGGVGVSASRSFVRGLGSRALGVAAEDGSRSSIRAVKTADGEYLVWVESFSLTFSNPSLAEMAAELLMAGRSSMRQALEWLKQGLPFNPEFAITHITEVPSRAADDEVLRAGPTCWGTVLQLPDSWVEAVSTAQLPEEQPLRTALEVPEGPAAFKIYLATPAGLAEATLLPELIAVLSQLPCTHEEHVLAVPINLTLQVPTADTEQEQQEQEQVQEQAARRGSVSRGQTAAGQAGSHNSSSDSKGGSPTPPAAAGRGLSAADRGKLGSQKGLTWADQQQREGSSDDCAADFFAADERRSFGGRVPAAVQQAASCTGGLSAAAGKSSLAMHHSRSTPHLGQLEQLLPDTASIEFDSCDEADRFEEEQELREQQQRDSRSAALRARADSSSSLPDLLPQQQRGLSVDSWKADAGIGSDLSTGAAAAGGAGAAGSPGTDEQRPVVVGGLSGSFRQQSSTHVSFKAEVHAVLHVRLLLDTENGSRMQPAPAAPCMPAAAAGQETAPAAAGRHISPFALAGALDVLDDSGLPLSGSALQMQHTFLPQTTSILQLGTTDPAPPSAAQQQLLQTTTALVAALLCGLALLLPSTGAASILVLCAALANLACMAAALQPVRFSRAARSLQRVLRLGRGGHAHAHGHLSRSSHAHHHHSSHHHHHHHHHHGVKRQHSKRPSAASGQHSTCAAAPARKLQGLRLQLLTGSFVKEPLGLLEQQIAAYRDSVESPDSCSVSFVSGSESGDDLESLEGSEDEELAEAVFVSNPEPAWLTRDWRRRLWNARPTMEERSQLAGTIHAWRQSVAADVILQRPPANFDWFQKHLMLRPLLTTPQGHVVVLLKLSTLSNMTRVLAGCGLTVTDLMRHCGFIWCWMFEAYAAADWPAGRFILLADMSGLKLGQAVGEGQIGGRALGEVCNAFPERLTRCLVLGAPNWFNMLYRLIRPQLSPSTRAKVQVCTTAAETVAELACCLGPEWVPAEYGGPCTCPYDDFPAQQALLQHVAKLHPHSA